MLIKSVEIMNRLVGEGNWITINGLDYNSIVLKEGVSKPSAEEYNKVKAEVESEIDYQLQRAKEYPSFAEQFDLLYHGGYDTWRQVIQNVKDKYPKS